MCRTPPWDTSRALPAGKPDGLRLLVGRRSRRKVPVPGRHVDGFGLRGRSARRVAPGGVFSAPADAAECPGSRRQLPAGR
jgi:hypothetical protein